MKGTKQAAKRPVGYSQTDLYFLGQEHDTLLEVPIRHVFLAVNEIFVTPNFYIRKGNQGIIVEQIDLDESTDSIVDVNLLMDTGYDSFCSTLLSLVPPVEAMYLDHRIFPHTGWSLSDCVRHLLFFYEYFQCLHPATKFGFWPCEFLIICFVIL